MYVTKFTEIQDIGPGIKQETPPIYGDPEAFHCSVDFTPIGRSGTESYHSKWVNGIVVYQFHRSFNRPGDRETVMKAMQAIEGKQACVSFKERSTEEFFVIITRDCDPKVRRCQNIGANAKIGAPHAYDRDSFLTVIQSLNPLNKAHVGLMVHELLHVLGMVHTQTRKDRDQYIEVYLRNVARGYRVNYLKCDDCEAHGIPYDCMSIMHYRQRIFFIALLIYV